MFYPVLANDKLNALATTCHTRATRRNFHKKPVSRMYDSGAFSLHVHPNNKLSPFHDVAQKVK